MRGTYKRAKLIYGVGVNDADYVTQTYSIINGKRCTKWKCPFYVKWKEILRRCYSAEWHLKHDTYVDCTVCDKWLTFSNFKSWMEVQDWEGKQLDKDLLVKGNKVYSPETCIFVHQTINKFMRETAKCGGMTGTNYVKQLMKYRATIHNPITKKQEHLGVFNTELEAHLAWKAKKHEYACMLSESELVSDPRLAEALRTRYV